MKNWSRPNDILKRVRRDWDNGRILASLIGGLSIFPLRIPLKKPTTKELSEQFDAARIWISEITESSKEKTDSGYRLEWREISHRQLGNNRIPIAAIIESEEDALALISKKTDANKFKRIANTISDRQPQLLPWLQKRPLTVLEQAENWSALLAVLNWVLQHPKPRIYLRQMDVEGVDTKFIERHKGILAELLDILLPPEAINENHTGVSGFEKRYGFKAKPLPVRFRFLDHDLYINGFSDLAVPSDEFARLSLPVEKIYIVENEINFLAFPMVPRSLVIFGSGYGFEHLAQANWLKEREIFYWGDIDTHGFAILNQLRNSFPATSSFLMNRETLMKHKKFWGKEDKAINRNLERLTQAESDLYDDLRFNRITPSLRLEQERISYTHLFSAL